MIKTISIGMVIILLIFSLVNLDEQIKDNKQVLQKIYNITSSYNITSFENRVVTKAEIDILYIRMLAKPYSEGLE